MIKLYRLARKIGVWLISLLIGLVTLLLLSTSLTDVITLFSWRDPWTRHRALNLLLIAGWLVLTIEVWLRFRSYSRWIRWGLTLGGAGLVMVLNWHLQPFMKSDWERLKELGIVERMYDHQLTLYRVLPIEEKLNIFLDVAHYVPSHPAEALKYMSRIIKESGPEAAEPVIWTIRAHLPHARSGDQYSERVVFWLSDGIYWEEAESLVIELLCDPRNEPLLGVRRNAEDVVLKRYYDMRLYQNITDERKRWTKMCEALLASGRWKPKK